MKYISSKDNPFYKDLCRLQQKKYRNSSSIFLAEGEKYLQYPSQLEHILIHEDQEKKYADSLPHDVPSTLLSAQLFSKLSSQENSQGIIACCKKTAADINELPDRLIALEEIKDPGNLGTIIRTMDAAGLTHLLLTQDSVDVYNDKTIRSSMGSIFHVDTLILPLNAMMDILIKKGYQIMITTLSTDSSDYSKIEWPQKFVLFFGNESRGISPVLEKYADLKVHIPIFGKAESLNIAISAAILMYKFTCP